MSNITKNLYFEIVKADDKDRPGYITGWASTPRLDSAGEIIDVGAFSESIKKRGLKGPRAIKFLLNHKATKIAGRLEALEYRGERLWIEAQFALDVGYVADFYKVTKMTEGMNFSVGFRNAKYRQDDAGQIHIYAADLMEVSAVPFPANEDCEMITVRADETIIATAAGKEDEVESFESDKEDFAESNEATGIAASDLTDSKESKAESEAEIEIIETEEINNNKPIGNGAEEETAAEQVEPKTKNARRSSAEKEANDLSSAEKEANDKITALKKVLERKQKEAEANSLMLKMLEENVKEVTQAQIIVAKDYEQTEKEALIAENRLREKTEIETFLKEVLVAVRATSEAKAELSEIEEKQLIKFQAQEEAKAELLKKQQELQAEVDRCSAIKAEIMATQNDLKYLEESIELEKLRSEIKKASSSINKVLGEVRAVHNDSADIVRAGQKKAVEGVLEKAKQAHADIALAQLARVARRLRGADKMQKTQ